MKKVVFLLFISFLFACSGGKSNNTIIAILPIGLNENQNFILTQIKNSIAENQSFKVVILPNQALPAAAFYKPRKRYKADKLLKHLKSIKPDSVDYILGITSEDISTTKNGKSDWGIFGLGYQPGKASVISLFRLGNTKSIMIKRVLKITKHELGHNFGLTHCTKSKYCVMHAAEGSIKTVDRVHNKFCVSCKEKLSK